MANIIKQIYELQDIGKGVINSLTVDNLLLLFEEASLQDFNDVLSVNNQTGLTAVFFNTDGDSAQLNANDGLYLVNDLNTIITRVTTSGISAINNINTETTSLNYSGITFRSASGTHIENIRRNPDTVLGDTVIYLPKTNGTTVTLAVERPSQKILTYPGNFSGTNYTLVPDDHDKLIIVKNGATNVTITVPDGLEVNHFNAIIRDGSGEITITPSGTTINSFDGLRINERYQQVALDREGVTTTFYLTGNTKV